MEPENGGIRALFICLLLATMFAGSALGNEACFDCHADEAFSRSGKGYVPREGFAAGAHSEIECSECHTGEDDAAFDVVPHRIGKLAITRCDLCHRDNQKHIIDEYRQSVHEERMPGRFGCVKCHDPHTMVKDRKDLPIDTRIELANHACLRCHRDADFRVAAKHGGEAPAAGTHDWLPSLEKHARMRCVVCHTPVEGDHDHLVLAKEKATRDCDACHGEDAPLVRKYVGADDRRSWITNPILFEEVYMPGTIRHRLVDGIVIGLFGLAVLGGLGHGLLRVATRGKQPKTPYVVESTKMYSLGLRLWHWSNALLFVLLAITGFRLHFGGREDPILSFETAFHIHNLAGVLLVVVGIVFFIQNLLTGNQRQYLSRPADGMRGIFRQMGFYLSGIFRGQPHPYHSTPERKFNPLQQVSYAKVMYLLFPLLLISGAILFFPKILPDKLWGKPGVWWVATVHYLSAAALVVFLLVHIYLATMGDKVAYLISAMFTGRHKHHVPKHKEGEE